MDFQQNFTDKLARDLVGGKYANANDFAIGITKHYMSSLKYNAPTSVPITKTAPVIGRVTVGPGNSITHKKRQDVFYNTVRAYFVGKEILQGKVMIRSLAQDIQSTTKLYKKTALQVQSLIKQVQELDDKALQLLEDVKKIKPAVKSFIEDKKQTLKDAYQEIQATIDRAKQTSRTTNANTFDYSAVLQQEIADVQKILTLKIEPTTNFAELRDTFATLSSFLATAQTTIKKYENTFTKEANLKVYLMKKVKSILNQILSLLNAVVNPEAFKNFWRDLSRVPNGKRIAQVMLSFLEQNGVLQEKKKQLVIQLEVSKKRIKDSIDRKLEDLQSKLQTIIDQQVERIKSLSKRVGATKPKTGIKKIANTIKVELSAYRALIQRIKRAIQLFKLIKSKITLLLRKIQTIYTALRQILKDSAADVQKIKQKYNDVKSAVEETQTPAARQARAQALADYKKDLSLKTIEQANAKLMETFGEKDAVIQGIVLTFQKLFNLNTQQLAAFFRIRTNKVATVIRNISEILEIDIPTIDALFDLTRVVRSLPQDAYNERLQEITDYETAYKKQGSPAAVDHLVKGRPDIHLNYIKMLNAFRKANKKVVDMQEKVEALLLKEQQKLTEQVNFKDDLQAYIDEVLDLTTEGKDIQNKIRKQEQEVSEVKRKASQLKKIAKQTRLAYNVSLRVPRVIGRIVADPLSKTPITTNESDLNKIVEGFLELQIERGKITKDISIQQKANYKAKIADLKAYEKIIGFLFDIIDSAKSYNDEFSDKGFRGVLERAYDDVLKNKVENTTERGKILIETLISLFTNAAQDINLQTLAKLPSELQTEANAAYALARTEINAFKVLQNKAERIGSVIPKGTNDPALRYIRRQLINGPGNWIVSVLKTIARFFKKLISFLSELLEPVLEFLHLKKREVEEKIQTEALTRADALVESKVNPTARIMSYTLGLAAKLFWTGTSWTNEVGTKFVVTSIGRFYPHMAALNTGTAQTFAEEMAYAYDRQLSRMRGLAIPAPATGVPPFTWVGYMGKEEYGYGY